MPPPSKDSRRQFSSTQRDEIFLKYNGRCGICGAVLEDDWQTDHIRPWSLGGQTTIDNGQPTCKKCNQTKGASFMEPRRWQSDFLRDYLANRKKEYLLVATPGAGKTSAALYAAQQKMQAGLVDQVIIVCPTESLKYQWAAVATKFGINLYPRYQDGLIKRDYHGICLTYAKTIHSHQMLHHICSNHNTLVVLDEIHHSGESLTWGDSIKAAFGGARYVLGLSGTPFRGDSNRIPYVTYENGIAVADFDYGYGDALKDQVCRKMMFPSLDGGAEFYHHGEVKRWDSFTDVIGNKEESQLLRAILHDVESEYMTEVLKDANERLDDIRLNSDANAAGLVIAMTISHANKIAKALERLTGTYPTVVHSDTENDAMTDIERFRDSRKISDKWIVAVKMVSEGVDIPRLRVGVYATNIIQELTFRQVTGRFVRRIDNYDDWAYLYVPLAPRLVEFMKRIQQEITHVLQEESSPGGISREPRDDEPRDPSLFVSLGTDRNPDEDLVISDDETYKLNAAAIWREKVKEVLDIKINEWQGAKIIKMWEGMSDTVAPSQKPTSTSEPIHKREEKLRKICNKSAYAVACRVEAMSSTAKLPREIVALIHYHWSNEPGNSKQKVASIEELERKIVWLDSGDIERNPGRYL